MHDKQLDRLLVRMAHGDNLAFEQLYAATRRGVFSFLYSYFGCYEDTEDAMQTAYLKIKINIDKYTAGTNARAWILQIAKNTALNELKAKKRKENEALGSELVAPAAGNMEISDAMQRALNDDEREIVILHVLWGYKHREIASMQNLPVGTVTAKYNRSIKKLEKYLKEADR